MTSYIRCPECGNSIGKYSDFIEKAKQCIYEEKVFTADKFTEYDPDKLCFNSNVTPSLEGLFDAIGLKLRCCRMHSTTKMRFEKIYK